jgi:mono/diheme cytochrome c family protein
MIALGAAAWLGAALLMAGGALLAAEEIPPEDVERFTDGDAANGGKLYKRYCSGCHGADGRGGAHTFMPHIQNLTRQDYIEFIPDGFLFTVIAEGGVAVGKSSMMPAWKATLSEQDIKDVIAFIRSLPTY